MTTAAASTAKASAASRTKIHVRDFGTALTRSSEFVVVETVGGSIITVPVGVVPVGVVPFATSGPRKTRDFGVSPSGGEATGRRTATAGAEAPSPELSSQI